MNPEVINLSIAAMSGAIGGLALFLFSLRRGHYKNNYFKKKAAIEIAGAFCVAPFIGTHFGALDNNLYRLLLASFVSGTCWSIILQVFRSKVTKFIEALLGEKFQ